jgi:energy-coupling factor transporter transmembrane protein EcfT
MARKVCANVLTWVTNSVFIKNFLKKCFMPSVQLILPNAQSMLSYRTSVNFVNICNFT